MLNLKGTLDIIVLSKSVEVGAGPAARAITMIENNFDHDAFFMKTISTRF